MNQTCKLLGLTVLAIFFTSASRAATILDFDFSGVAGNTSQTKATFELVATNQIDPNLAIVEGVNFKADSALNSSTSGGQATNDLNLANWGTSISGAITDAINGFRYYAFTVQPDPGYRINLDGASVVFTGWRNGSAAPESFGMTAQIGPGTIDASDEVDAVLTPFGAPGSAVSGIDNSLSFSFTFSGSQWNGITAPVEIRLYGWNADNNTGNFHASDLAIDNATVTAVPEPSTLAMLLGLAGVGLVGWMRRRRSG